MKRTITTWIALMMSLIVVAQEHQSMTPQKKLEMLQFQKLIQVSHYISKLYVDDVDMLPITESAVRAMLEDLDPHSAYIDKEEMKGVHESFDGEFSGIGVQFAVLKDTIHVVNTIAGGPSERVGMMPNDRIVKIDTLNAVGMRQVDVPKYLRGKKGSRVKLEVVRHGIEERLSFTITRDNIPLNTVDAAYMATPRIGYIKINRFGKTTFKEFIDAYEKLDRPSKLILDLQANGGGLLDQAIDLAGFFLPKGTKVVSTEGRVVPEMGFSSASAWNGFKGEVAVLIDETSASASEIVAGALQDWDRAVIIGRPSFGKGLVQRQIELGDGSAIRLTVARYHTPSGRVIQRPYEKGKRTEYYQNHLKRYDNNLLDSMDRNAPSYKTLNTQRTVYGGGGIRPDVMVAVDTTGYTPYVGNLVRQGVINEWVWGYMDTQREVLNKKYPKFNYFLRHFTPSTEMISQLAQLGKTRGVEIDSVALNRSEKILQLRIKSLIAQQLFDIEAFYHVINEAQDNAYHRAIEILSNWEVAGKPILEPHK